jgi:uncharacterized membrane protein YhaH (DUF805 family)
MGITDAVKTCFSKYATFSSRAARPEYWYFSLFAAVVELVLWSIDTVLVRFDPLTTQHDDLVAKFFHVAIFLPMLAAGWRRMHDTGRPGWLLLLPFVAGLVASALLYFLALGGIQAPGGTRDQNGLPPAWALVFLARWLLWLVLIWWLVQPS